MIFINLKYCCVSIIFLFLVPWRSLVFYFLTNLKLMSLGFYFGNNLKWSQGSWSFVFENNWKILKAPCVGFWTSLKRSWGLPVFVFKKFGRILEHLIFLRTCKDLWVWGVLFFQDLEKACELLLFFLSV